MSIPKALDVQRDFSAGQMDRYGERRDDTDLHKAAVKLGRNLRPLEVGGAGRRPGRRVRYLDRGRADTVRVAPGVEHDVLFGAGRFVARRFDGTIVNELVGCPWTDGMLDDLSIHWTGGQEIYVAHREMPTQVITHSTVNGLWTRAAYAFRTGQNGERRMPFYRFAVPGVTMTPSALTGSGVTFTFSAAVPNLDDLVGTIIRYVGKQILVTGYVGPTSVKGTVLQDLPPSQRVTVGSTAGYSVGDVVEGDVTSARGEIATIVSATVVDLVLMTSFSGFDASGEFLIGPNARSAISAVASHAPVASVQWDEQFVSDFRGWPGFVGSDRQRLIFCDFDQLEGGVLWSAIGAFDDIKVSAAGDGAIFEILPHAGRALCVLGGGDEFVVSDSKVYYIPISANSPLVPGSVEFRPISSEGAARVRPVSTGDGAIYVSANRQRIYAIQATGQQAQPYIARPINDLHTALFNSPVAVAAAAGVGGMGGQHLFVVNADGTLAVGRYDAARDWMGWFPWDGPGRVQDMAGRFDQLTVMVSYQVGAGTVYAVEEFDQTLVMDGVIDGDDSANLSPLAGAAVRAMSGDFHLGTATIQVGGTIAQPFDGFSNVFVGFPFTVAVSPFIENFNGGQDFGQRKRRRKVADAVITVRDTDLFTAGGRRFAGWRIGEDQSASRPGRDMTYRWRGRGRSFDPEEDITQEVPGRFNMIELALSVTI